MKDCIEINDLRRGNHRVYEELFIQWYNPLCNYAYSILHDAEDAKDIVQKVFYKLWEQRSELEIHTSMKSYLYRIVHNDALNKLKQLKIRNEHNQDIAYLSCDFVDDTANTILYNELQQKIKMAINHLPPRCREVFELSRFQQLSYMEIANKLNISTNTVETQMVKALRLLRNDLKDYLTV
ncbi:MAG: RNA polymerase sigma-70 factor [Bacteroidales bacterium]|nr:RNA polymerase sigma-70 factor [Bacteroidales bacterium]